MHALGDLFLTLLPTLLIFGFIAYIVYRKKKARTQASEAIDKRNHYEQIDRTGNSIEVIKELFEGWGREKSGG